MVPKLMVFSLVFAEVGFGCGYTADFRITLG